MPENVIIVTQLCTKLQGLRTDT